jgi:hypothetical protein
MNFARVLSEMARLTETTVSTLMPDSLRNTASYFHRPVMRVCAPCYMLSFERCSDYP